MVTANKALLADDGPALHAAAAKAGVDLYYEAAVAGAIPLLRPLRESLAGDQLRRVVGIVNGTTNYILSRWTRPAPASPRRWTRPPRSGYAEADPTADVEGFDAAAKAAILASLAFHTPVAPDDVYREGITEVTAADVARAAEIGCTVKLLAICERVPTGRRRAIVAVRVHPAMIPPTHPLAAVGEAFNAVFVEAEAAGQLMFYGRGAGGEPTASAVLGDLVAVARNRLAGAAGPGPTGYAEPAVRPMGETPTRYHVSLDVADKPGVLARRAGVRRARRDHLHRPPGRARRRRDAGHRHPQRARRRAVRHRRGAAGHGHRPRRSPACCAWRDCHELTCAERRSPRLAGAHRGLPVAAAGHRRDPGGHAARGRHAAGAGAASCPSAPAARCGSRSRAPTRPAPSRTAA